MVKHIIIWNLKDELSAEEKKERCRLIKQGLESLAGKIDGLIEIKVITDILGSSTGDLMLGQHIRERRSVKGLFHPPRARQGRRQHGKTLHGKTQLRRF